MLLGLGTFSELPFGDPNNAQIHNIEFAETGFGMTFTLGTEVATGGANVSPTTAGAITFSIGDETAFGESFQNLISFSTGEPDFFVWNETDDSQTATWKDVEPGSSD
tara:strand:+ start:6208 stop:6528 length:321 start_codon:yes stop_codon:yes gene_type:complete